MSVSLEFIKELPERMQLEITNLNSQIEALEAKRAAVSLPVDVAISFDLLAANKAEAEMVLAKAEVAAAIVLGEAKGKAEEFIRAAKVAAADAEVRIASLWSDVHAEEDKLKAKKAELVARADELAKEADAVSAAKKAHDERVAAHKKKAKAVISVLSEL
jgi:cell division septum initiation protein DivIVA